MRFSDDGEPLPSPELASAKHAIGGRFLKRTQLQALDTAWESVLRPDGPPSPNMVRRTQEARRAHDLGLSLVPLIGKRPVDPGWSRRPRESLEEAERWATRGNVGVRTGSASGVLVIDVDSPDLEPTLAAAGLGYLGGIPTWRVRTGSGKWHLYFRSPVGVHVHNSAGALGPSIDVRAEGGQVVAPGSIHPDTAETYQWSVGPDDVPLADLPEQLLPLITRPPREDAPAIVAGPGCTTAYGKAALGAECSAVAEAKEGTRNDRLNTAAFAVGQLVGGGELTEAEAVERLAEAARSCGLPDHEAGATIRSGLTAGKEKPRAAPVEFQTDEHGRPYGTPHNVRVSIQRQGVHVWYDEFADRVRIEGLAGLGPYLDDAAVIRLRLVAQEGHKVKVAKEEFYDVVLDLARRNGRHPVREYLAGVTWDGTPRIDGWLSTYLGVEPTPYTAAVGSLVLVAAVRRVRQPGCKFDEMLILESHQGSAKSSVLETLAVRKEWFGDDLPLGADTKRAMEAIAGRWIIEAAELAGMRRGEIEGVKAFLSRSVDSARLAYGRLTTHMPRQCVVIGTTNSAFYLRDRTGNRRFWPVRVGTIDLDALKRDRDQLWAEAANRESAGASIRLDPSLYSVAAEAQTEREQTDPFEESLSPLLSGRTGRIRTADLWAALGHSTAAGRTQDANNRLGETMTRLGWEKRRLRFGGNLEYCYVRGDAAEQERVLSLDLL